MGAIPLSCHVILNRFLRSSPLLSFSLFKQSTSTTLQTTPLHITLTPTPTHSLCCIPSTTQSISSSQALLEPQNDAVHDNNDNKVEPEREDIVEGLKGVLNSDAENDNINTNNKNNIRVLNVKLPSLSIKEKKELASYAHSLGKKLKSQQIGKSGVTDTVITALVETLEANELLKLKIHGNCPTELDDAVKQVEEGTGSVVVSQIGRTVILYRPSLTKMKAEEKKKQAQRFLVKKQMAFQSKGQIPRQSGRGRRGSSRV